MNKDILEAYEHLVPADQLIVYAMIVALYTKDQKNKALTDHILQGLQELDNEKST